jgi:uncharacterized protein (DUF362 family)
MILDRRQFLSLPVGASLASALPEKPRVGFVRSTHPRLARPAPLDDPLDYERVRDMVWKAIEYAPPRAGSLEAKIPPGAWVVIKPNIVFLRPQPSYAPGDITDMRVTKAVLEYVARRSRARRITIAEGGSYRRPSDPMTDSAVLQNGRRVDALSFDWGAEEFPGWSGTLGAMLKEFAGAFPDKQFDYADLAYDAVRDPSGNFVRIEVPKTARGVGGFGARTDYYVTNTIRNCDFLISVPVLKIHEGSGITCCLKNYVGTAPREAYAAPGRWWNVHLHEQHALEGRIDSFICDLAAFHPPDYNVVDAIRGLQYMEHNIGKPDQSVRNNMVLAGEDTVATDALAAYLAGFNVWDMEFLHMAVQRDLGPMELNRIDVAGDEPDRARWIWGKPNTRRGPWHGRCNRQWRVGRDPGAPVESLQRVTIPTDTLNLTKLAGPPGETPYIAVARVRSEGNAKVYLWLGLRGRVTAKLNGETVLEVENTTRYRIGQFRQPVTLRSGENQLLFEVRPAGSEALLSVLLVGPRNDGDTADGIRWLA